MSESRVIIETDWLLLRTWKPSDLAPMTVINQDSLVMEHFPGLQDRVATKAFIERVSKHQKAHGYGLYAVEEKIDQSFIGFVGLNIPDFKAHFTPAVEIGWRLGSTYWNKGYATEAAKAVLQYAFNVLDLKEVVSFTIPANKKSIKVMEKLGMKRDLSENFDHPRLPKEHPLCRHILYRLSKEQFLV